MAEEDPESKTEEPTERKLRRAEEEGQVVVSQEIKTWVMLLGALVMIGLLMPWFLPRIGGTLRLFVERPHAIPVSMDNIQVVLVEVVGELALILMVPVAVLVILAIAASVGQTGFIITPKRLRVSLNTISPIQGAKRIFSLRQLLEFLKGLAKFTMVGVIVLASIWPHLHELKGLTTVGLTGMLAYVQDMMILILIAVLILMLVVAVIDQRYQSYAHRKKLRMTKQEVKDEHKQTEGDPQVKRRIARLRVQRARERIMQSVPKADVVITNPTHFAVALQYDMATMNAPVVVAKGVDHLAKRIREVAIENDVTIVENPPLARALYAAVELDQEIPAEHYKAVAEIIGYVMRLKGKL